MSDLLDVFAHESYILGYVDSDNEVLIVLKEGCRSIDQLQAWMHALLLAKTIMTKGSSSKLDGKDTSPTKYRLGEMRRTLEDARALFAKYAELLTDKGWDLNVAALETKAGTRAKVDSQ